MRTNAEQILRENFKNVEGGISFAEYVKLESESDPNFFSWFFDESIDDAFDLSQDQEEEFESFLKRLYAETGWFYRGFPEKIYNTRDDAEFDAASDFAADAPEADYFDADGDFLVKKFERDADDFVKRDDVVMTMKQALERGLTTLETLEIR